MLNDGLTQTTHGTDGSDKGALARDILSALTRSGIARTLDGHPLLETLERWVVEGDAPGTEQMQALIRDVDRQGPQRMLIRDAFIERFGFAIPHPEAILEIAAIGPLVEVAAGSGALAAALAHAGADIVASDGALTHVYEAPFTVGRWFPVDAPADAAETIAAHPDRTVVLSWPDGDDWPVRALDAMTPGQRLVHIGEEEGGCCGGWLFHETLARDFVEERILDSFRFAGLHDGASVYRKTA